MTQEQFEESICKIKSGQKEGLHEIYEAYLGYIYSVVYGIVQNKENAEDITSEFFIKLFTIADSYQENSNGHKGYLATIARNMALDFLRKNRHEILTEEFDEEGSEPETVESEVIGNMTLQEALKQLKESERVVVDMKVLGELTFKEIAEVLKQPMGTVTWKYQNAIKKLRRCGFE